jgi:hypothetical protein
MLTHICGSAGCDRDLAKARDQRISAVNEFLLSVKVIKVNSIPPFCTSTVPDVSFLVAECLG